MANNSIQNDETKKKKKKQLIKKSWKKINPLKEALSKKYQS
jgi:hypothetical protein